MTSVVALIGYDFLDKGKLLGWDWVKPMAPWLNGSYMTGAVVLIAIAILLNREDLEDLNVDRFFLFIFIYCGFAIFFEFFWGFGCLAGIATILFAIYILSKNNLKSGSLRPKVLWISLIVICIFVLLRLAVSLMRRKKNKLYICSFLSLFPVRFMKK